MAQSSETRPPHKFFARVLNGAIGGVVGTSIIYPLDFGKTRMQDQTTLAGAKNLLKGESPYKNVIDVILKVGRTQGITAVYKGLGVNLFFVMPEKAIKLSMNDQIRSMLGSHGGKVLSLRKEVFAGSLAGLCQVVITTPMELLKIQMQVMGKNSSTVEGGRKPSAIRIAMDLLKKDGPKSMYRGIGPTLMRDVSFSAIYFPFFAHLNSKGFRNDQGPPPFFHTLYSGLIAGSVAAYVVTPLDVIKTRLQVIRNLPTEAHYEGIVDCFQKTLQNDGLRAFFRGSVARVTVIAPLFGIAQTVYFLGIGERILNIA